MPTHAYTIKAGTTSKVFLVYARDANDSGAGKTGLSLDAPGTTLAYLREGDGDVHLVPLSAGTVGEWETGGFAEVDPRLMPGIYQIGVPDEMLAPGATRAVLILRCPGAAIDPVDVDLVAFDPQDPVRLGMSALGPEERIAALKGAFPRLAAKEIEERQALMDRD